MAGTRNGGLTLGDYPLSTGRGSRRRFSSNYHFHLIKHHRLIYSKLRRHANCYERLNKRISVWRVIIWVFHDDNDTHRIGARAYTHPYHYSRIEARFYYHIPNLVSIPTDFCILLERVNSQLPFGCVFEKGNERRFLTK